MRATLCCTFMAAVSILAAAPVFAQKAAAPKGEANVVLHSTITGNQEQPKVLYIVPWQGPGGADQLMQPVQPVINDVFTPVDRNEFQRELKYRAQSPTQTGTLADPAP